MTGYQSAKNKGFEMEKSAFQLVTLSLTSY